MSRASLERETTAALSHERAYARRARMERAPHFIEGRFVNPAVLSSPRVEFGVLREFFAPRVSRRPPAALPMISPLDGWRDPPRTGLRTAWLGHSTVLLEIDGARILTDPVWADRASPTRLAGPKRFHEPPVAIASLPPLDAILVSHDHYDHLDAAAVRLLATTSQARFFTALGVGARLEGFGVPHDRITELDWWEEAPIPGTDVAIAATPAQHFSGRGPFDRNTTLWASYVFRGPRHRVFFSGDTGPEPTLPLIRKRFGPFDLILLEVGAFHPAWGDIHLGPWQAMEAHRALGGGPFLPVHWSTFDLALHTWDEPIVVLEEGARDGQFDLPLVAPRIGEVRDVLDPDDIRRSLARLDAWWREVR
ncbi:MBL fold metallo-hydrolase [Polyangium fumosum]|nr:MBL fold metallo-hydrolase [Polyangium fumosum]